VGVGGKGRVDVEGVNTENIVALCDVDEERATESFKAHPKATKYRDFRRMLEKEKDIDAITISTPDHMHAMITMAAMKMGKHVYTQKPITRTVQEARKITNFAKMNGIATQMGNQGHANEGPRLLNELIWQGSIGKVHEVHCWTDRPVWPQGISEIPTGGSKVPSTLDWDLWLGVANNRPYHSAYVPFNWRAWWDFGAGALGDMGCHIMDYPFWALKLTHPENIEAYSTPVFKETAPHASMITYTFKSGIDPSTVKLTWYDGGLKPPIPPGLISDKNLWEKGSGVLFVGDLGQIVYGHHRPKPFLIIDGKEENYEQPKEMISRSIGHYQEWISECKGEKHRAMSNFEYAGPLTEAVLLGNVALRAGKGKLEWDPKNLNVSNMPDANQYLQSPYREGWKW
jgi:predicted dehydrogenase